MTGRQPLSEEEALQQARAVCDRYTTAESPETAWLAPWRLADILTSPPWAPDKKVREQIVAVDRAAVKLRKALDALEPVSRLRLSWEIRALRGRGSPALLPEIDASLSELHSSALKLVSKMPARTGRGRPAGSRNRWADMAAERIACAWKELSGDWPGASKGAPGSVNEGKPTGRFARFAEEVILAFELDREGLTVSRVIEAATGSRRSWRSMSEKT